MVFQRPHGCAAILLQHFLHRGGLAAVQRMSQALQSRGLLSAPETPRASKVRQALRMMENRLLLGLLPWAALRQMRSCHWQLSLHQAFGRAGVCLCRLSLLRRGAKSHALRFVQAFQRLAPAVLHRSTDHPVPSRESIPQLPSWNEMNRRNLLRCMKMYHMKR